MPDVPDLSSFHQAERASLNLSNNVLLNLPDVTGYGSSHEAERAGFPECDREGGSREDVDDDGATDNAHPTSRHHRLCDAHHIRGQVVKVTRKQGNKRFSCLEIFEAFEHHMLCVGPYFACLSLTCTSILYLSATSA